MVPESFNKMLDNYRSASAFSCDGDITTGAKDSQMRSQKSFTLSFGRPDRFDLNLIETDPASQRMKTNRVFMIQGQPYSQTAPYFRTKEESSLSQALKSCRGASGGMSELIPPLLLGTNVFDKTSIVQQPDAQVNGIMCFHFSALTVRKQSVELFVDQKDFAILELQRTFRIEAKQIPSNSPDLAKMANSEFITTITCRNFKFN